MKIQDLAIIFVIIILPISLVISAYTQYQIKTVSTQTLYDAKLTLATYDAIKAFQLNAQNSSTSNLANSRIRDLEASVSTFKNSLMATFRLNGYSEDDLNQYIPALVYTLYDGFYIYSPFNNINYQYEAKEVDDEGNVIEYDYDKPIQNNGQDIYGLKPYINYSCRYKKENIDVVITYALDNHISVQGKIGTDYVNKSGYLVDGITIDTGTGEVTYKEITIEKEELKEYLPLQKADSTANETPDAYSYVKINGVKYYRVDLIEGVGDEEGYDTIIYISNGTINTQCKLTPGEGLTGYQEKQNDEYERYCKLIKENDQAIEYYKKAEAFTRWLRNDSGLIDLKYEDAYEIQEKIDGYEEKKIWEGNSTKIFDIDNIENELSNFNQHRLAVIRHTIEKNLANAIANYNTFSGATNDFQMPELKEDEWDNIINNISMISFLQGLNIGGKVYNGYTIVTNSESEEVVLEENIYILGDNTNYHKIGDKELENGLVLINGGSYSNDGVRSAGRINLDFNKKYILNNSNLPYYYYSLKDYTASYKSIIMQDEVTPYEDIYAYIDKTDNPEDRDLQLAKAFYTALGRERESKYDVTRVWDITKIVPDVNEDPIPDPTPVPDPDPIPVPEPVPPLTYTITYDAKGGTGVPGTQQKIAEIPVRLFPMSPTKEGHTFMGWSTDSSATTVEYLADDIFTIDDNVTLYAVWKIKSFTVTLNANGGTIIASATPTATASMEYGKKMYIPPETFAKKPGYILKGWSINPLAEEAEYGSGQEVTITSDLTLYAVWKAENSGVAGTYNVTFNGNGGTLKATAIGLGSGTLTRELTTNVSTIPSIITTRVGYDFKGWSTSPSNTIKYRPGDVFKETTDITLYAVWAISGTEIM